jgi:hypothetical protein
MADVLLAQGSGEKVAKIGSAHLCAAVASSNLCLRAITTRRALSEDPKVIGEWFNRVKDTLVEFGMGTLAIHCRFHALLPG